MFNKSKILILALVVFFLALGGCASKQVVNKFSGSIPQHVCIAKNSLVKDGVLGALQDGFKAHGVKTQVVDATYEEKNKVWTPTIVPGQTAECDAVVFYVANWHWDLAMYMIYANIWITNPERTQKIANTSYRAGTGPDKFIDARTKLLEMVDGLFAGS